MAPAKPPAAYITYPESEGKSPPDGTSVGLGGS